MEAKEKMSNFSPEEMLFFTLFPESRQDDGYSSINPALIERGEILKSFVYQDSQTEISLLMLSPRAKIRRHKHEGEKEGYYNIQTREIMQCQDGEEHELENTSDTTWMSVLSVKIKTSK